MSSSEQNDMAPRFRLIHRASGTFPSRTATPENILPEGNNNNAATSQSRDEDVIMGEADDNVPLLGPLPGRDDATHDSANDNQGDVPDSPVYDPDDDYLPPSNMTDDEAAALAAQLEEDDRTSMEAAMQDVARREAETHHQELRQAQHNPTPEQTAEWARLDAEEDERLHRAIVSGNLKGRLSKDENGNDSVFYENGTRRMACDFCRGIKKPCIGIPCDACKHRDIACTHYDGPVAGEHKDWEDRGRRGPQPSKGLAKKYSAMPGPH